MCPLATMNFSFGRYSDTCITVHIMNVLFQVMITHVRSQTRFEARAMAMEFLCQLSIDLQLIWLNTIKYEYKMCMIWYKYVTIEYVP